MPGGMDEQGYPSPGAIVRFAAIGRSRTAVSGHAPRRWCGVTARTLVAALGMLAAACGRTSPFLDELEETLVSDPIVRGCDKVDYLFVIDDSASMADYQRRLAENFATFIDGVQSSQDSLASVHVGVITTAAYPHNPYPCNGLGDLIVHTGGYNSSETQCGPFADGNAYMTEQDDLEAAFSCTAKVGTQGSNHETPLRAIGYALNEKKLEAGGCNAGFVRDDALLVLVSVTDEDDPDTIDFAYPRAVDAKQGHDDNIVVVTLANAPDGPCTPRGYGRTGFRVTEFAEAFEHAFVGAICSEDYAPAFLGAVDVVAQACG